MSDVLGIGQTVSGVAQAGATIAAAQEQAGAARHAADLQEGQYRQTREDFTPWRTAGGSAVTQQANLMGLNGQPAADNAFASFRTDPSYNWELGQTVQAVDRSAAARGLLNSGATIKAIQDRAANLADTQYGNWYNRLAGISGTGQTATGSTAAAGQAAAANAGNALIQAGQARASGYTGLASTLNQGLNNYFANPRNGSGGGSWFDPYMGGGAANYSGDGNGEFYGL